MFTIYGIPNCDTVKKARMWLDKNGMEYEFHDYKKVGITSEKIQDWFKEYPWQKLVNKASTTWKALTDEEKALVQDEKSATDLMVEKTSVIKRPVLEDSAGKAIAVGFSEKEFERILL